ncbi:hypothetical protein HQ560_04850 [bacterium]|nr:hypothetical protein [bacterium]
MDTMVGIGWTMLGALFLGTFALPSKYIKNYAWENTWAAFFVFGMLVVPIGFSALVVKDLLASYEGVSGGVIFGVIALSFLWGCGFCCWGTGLSMVGLSLGYSLTMGTMALVGSIVPFFLGNADKALTGPGMVVIGGILVCIVGVAFNGVAGMKREKLEGGGETEGEPKKTNMALGVFICVLAGVLSSGLNIAFHIGNNVGGIAANAEKLGNPAWIAGLSTWTLVFLGGMISSVGYTVFLLCKNKTWGGFKNQGSCKNLTFAFIMAVGHFACIFFYGIGGWKLGALGTSVGFSIFQSGSLLIGNGLGFMTGEWQGASSDSKKWLGIGLGTLILGIVIVSVGNGIMP